MKHGLRRWAAPVLRFACAPALLAACTSIAGLDGLHLERRDDRSQPDQGSKPYGADVDAGGGDSLDATTADGGDADATVNPDAPSPRDGAGDGRPDGDVITGDGNVITPDGGDDLCQITGTCACDSGADCTHAGFDCCNGRCTDLSSDSDHCGACANSRCSNGRTCNGGTCTCGDLDNSCSEVCVDYWTDPNHCGRCGHSCLGGDCFGQACQPFAVATQQPAPTGLTLDGTGVYFTNADGGSIGRVDQNARPQAGACTGDQCLVMPSSLFKEPIAIVSDANQLYVASHAGGGVGVIAQVAKDFSSAAELARGKGITGLAIANGRLFWSSTGDRAVVSSVSVGGGAVTSIATATPGDGAAAGLAVDGASIVFGTSRASATIPFGMFHLSIGGGTCTDAACRPVQALSAAPRAITLSNGWLFWATSDGQILRIRKTGGCDNILPCPVVIATGQPDPRALVVDGDYVYWSDASGSGTFRKGYIYRTCKGLACQIIAGDLGTVVGVTQDTTAFYMASVGGPSTTGSILKLAK